MSQDFITRNLTDQSGNFGQETVIGQAAGGTNFLDPVSGQPIARSLNANSFELQNSPLDASFQLDPQGYNFARSLFDKQGVPTNLSNTFGAIAAVTAKDRGVSASQLFANGVPSADLLENVNFFRSAHSQIGFNSGTNLTQPWQNNFVLGSKIQWQTG
jgi:hypothetical protein